LHKRTLIGLPLTMLGSPACGRAALAEGKPDTGKAIAALRQSLQRLQQPPRAEFDGKGL
jgi:hypothetical protein